MGDFNIDLLACESQYAETYTDIMFDNNFYPLINKPTRVTTTRCSAIYLFIYFIYLFFNSGTRMRPIFKQRKRKQKKDIYNNESTLDLTNITIQHCFKMTEKFRANQDIRIGYSNNY